MGPFIMCSRTWGQEHPRVWIRVMLCPLAVLAPWGHWWALITLSSVTWTPTHPSVCPLAKSCCCYQPQSLAGLPPARDSSQGCKGRAGRFICGKRTGCWQHRSPQLSSDSSKGGGRGGTPQAQGLASSRCLAAGAWSQGLASARRMGQGQELGQRLGQGQSRFRGRIRARAVSGSGAGAGEGAGAWAGSGTRARA